MKRTISQCVKAEQFAKPLWLEKVGNMLHDGLYEIMSNAGSTAWYVSFNGNSKQRRQQQRKLIRDLNS